VCRWQGGQAIGWTINLDIDVQNERLEIGWTWYGASREGTPDGQGRHRRCGRADHRMAAARLADDSPIAVSSPAMT